MNDLSGIRALGAMLLRSAVNHAKAQSHRLDRTEDEIDADIHAIRDAAEFKYQEEAEQRRRDREGRIVRLRDGLQDEYQADKDDEREKDWTR